MSNNFRVYRNLQIPSLSSETLHELLTGNSVMKLGSKEVVESRSRNLYHIGFESLKLFVFLLVCIHKCPSKNPECEVKRIPKTIVNRSSILYSS